MRRFLSNYFDLLLLTARSKRRRYCETLWQSIARFSYSIELKCPTVVYSPLKSTYGTLLFRIQTSGLIRIQNFRSGRLPVFMPDRFQNVVDLSSCRRQSFRRVSWKSGRDCMRNANKSPKIPDSSIRREERKWSGIRIPDRITTECESVLPIGRPNHKFQWNPDSEFQIWTFAGLYAGSLPKCCGFIILSASVISPSVVKIGERLYEKC